MFYHVFSFFLILKLLVDLRFPGSHGPLKVAEILASRQHARKRCPEGDQAGFHERQREPLGIRQGQLSPKGDRNTLLHKL